MLTVTSFTLHRMQRATWPPTHVPPISWRDRQNCDCRIYVGYLMSPLSSVTCPLSHDISFGVGYVRVHMRELQVHDGTCSHPLTNTRPEQIWWTCQSTLGGVFWGRNHFQASLVGIRKFNSQLYLHFPQNKSAFYLAESFMECNLCQLCAEFRS